jgi:hypothetical protein
MPRIIKPEKLSIRNHPEINERFIQDQIANDPSMIGLGDLIVKDKERMQPRAGRLDLLLMDPDTTRRYEVEIQLGKTDESHIIRTIEYWDIERKRYPQYDHCAVIIAEDITSRFLNVIHLFNGYIPFIAIQMSAYQYEGGISLIFTKVLDEMPLGLIEDDEIDNEKLQTTKDYWVKKASPETVKIAEKFLEIFNEVDPGHDLSYLKTSVALSKKGIAIHYFFLRIRKKNHIVLVIKMIRDPEFDSYLDNTDLDQMEYNVRASRYRIRISMDDVTKRKETVKGLLIRIQGFLGLNSISN